jgi:ligand-binding SRPBCC domain-containing protein
MGNRLLQTDVFIPRSPAEVFAFFADASNLERLTPRWINFRIVTPLPIEMKQGTMIDYTIRIHGIPVKWRTEIEAWEPPRRFVDTQRRGPYSLWRHEHTFEEVEGGTLCGDRVAYRAPMGWLTHPLLVDRDVRRIFEYRRNALLEVFGVKRDHFAVS